MASPLYRYQTLTIGKLHVHMRTLLDNQQFSDDQGAAEALGISSASWPLFGTLWPSGQVLAQLMQNQDITNKRILEVGCGMALSSHVLNARHADITATDYHPAAEEFLLENTRINAGKPIPFTRTGWGDPVSNLGFFDLIIGSDLLYEAEHVPLLAGFINQHAKPECDVVIIDPGRGNHAKFSKRMVALGFSHSQYAPDTQTYLSAPFKGRVLQYHRSGKPS
ncbi:protein N-lysine methyltransferase family protein [Simiduia sp. 21SJ11W-1]|uniref:class I SAM-dependent methyltransferase n=1 Tax=Simiduia sp. 21SJ11W-1 TaxID=2909669 RepID=UPI00209F2230|nr:protein N-lysine methyltransferase family protein [Simiduia sp. 21SJ11W-1]UTA46892.1 protein N-lysine methyltransferase family protein [Simiduia sp. 21SJ11W-1]